MSKPLITEYQKASTVLEDEQELLNEETEQTAEAVKEAESKSDRKLIDEILRK